MPLDLPDGASCFLDSNILYYALVSTPPVSAACLTLIDRIIAGKINAFASIPVLADTMHKVMISEIATLTGRDRAGLIGHIGKHPELIATLTQYPQVPARLREIPLTVLPLVQQLLLDASVLALQQRLFTNDSLIVALMQRHALTHLVTNDNDFDRVPGISVWKPH